MKIVKLEIEDSKLNIILNIIQNLKDDVITKYEVVNESKEQKEFISISHSSLEKI